MQRFRRNHFPHAAFKRQSAIPTPGIGSRSRPLGAQVVQFAINTAHLTVEKASAIAQSGIVFTKLVAVIAQRQERARSLKLAKCFNEICITHGFGIQSQRRQQLVITKAQNVRWELSRSNQIVVIVTEQFQSWLVIQRQ